MLGLTALPDADGLLKNQIFLPNQLNILSRKEIWLFAVYGNKSYYQVEND